MEYINSEENLAEKQKGRRLTIQNLGREKSKKTKRQWNLKTRMVKRGGKVGRKGKIQR